MTLTTLIAASALALGMTGQGLAVTPTPVPSPGLDQPGVDQPAGSLTAQQKAIQGNLAATSQDIETETAASAQAVAALATAEAALPKASAALAVARQAEVTAQAAVMAADAAVADTQRQLAALGTRSAAEKAQVAAKRAALDQAVRASYIDGPQGLARDVLNATDPSVLLDDSVALGRQGQLTGAALQQLDAAIRSLNVDIAQITTDNTALLLQQKSAIASANQAAAATAKAAASAENLQSLVHARANAAAVVKSQLAADNARYGELQQESDKITSLLAAAAAAEAARAAATSTPSTLQPGPSGLLWPTSGPVTSPFGYRVDPVTHVRALHAGVDIGAPEGQPIMAAQSGVVAFAGQEQGYGNYTCIEHGHGFATCYAHQSAILVTVGESVVRGQRIGLVGETGYATGPHLHFETRVNGVPVNPMQYF